MSSQEDIDKLTDADKLELRNYINNEQQRSQIQTQTHHVTQLCWKKCITGNIKGSQLDRTEEACMTNCVERFLDINMLTIKHLNSMRSG